MAGLATKIGRLQANRTMFLLCDMQEKFRPSIQHFEDIAQVSSRLVGVCAYTMIRTLVILNLKINYGRKFHCVFQTRYSWGGGGGGGQTV